MSTENSSKKTMPITQWALEDRPREKMAERGKKSLTDSELLAILLRTGIPGHSAIDIAKDMMAYSGNKITNLSRLEVADIKREFKGLGTAKAVTVLAALELGNRMLKEANENKDYIIRNCENLFHYIAPQIIDLPREEFWAVYLSSRNKVLGRKCIGMGGITQTTVDVRLIFQGALEFNAIGVAVAHNHPSGQLAPSQADKELTQRIAKAGDILQIKLIEHIIVGITSEGKRDYYSFTENGLL